jgi:hypothetical protein
MQPVYHQTKPAPKATAKKAQAKAAVPAKKKKKIFNLNKRIKTITDNTSTSKTVSILI